MSEVYLLTNLANGKVYVGQTCQGLEQRFAQHVRDTKRRQYRIHCALKKYGKNKFYPLTMRSGMSQSDTDNFEKLLIVLFSSTDKLHGYNMQSGGDGGGGMTPEIVAKISASRMGIPAHNKGVPMSPEQREKLSKTRWVMHLPSPMKGKKMSEESKKRMRAKWTPERRAALSLRSQEWIKTLNARLGRG